MGDKLLIVTTDRISAFDVILPTGIPDKGVVLNQISLYWFKQVEDLIPNHLISSDLSGLPEPFQKAKDQLRHRSVVVQKAKPLAAECIVRGYLTGSGLKDPTTAAANVGSLLVADPTPAAVAATLGW